jgi:hypothetical protein
VRYRCRGRVRRLRPTPPGLSDRPGCSGLPAAARWGRQRRAEASPATSAPPVPQRSCTHAPAPDTRRPARECRSAVAVDRVRAFAVGATGIQLRLQQVVLPAGSGRVASYRLLTSG